MNSEVVGKALDSCLDSLESFVATAILLAVAVFWPALRNRGNFEILSVKVERRFAFPLLSTVYVLLNVAILILFLRLVFLIELIGDDQESYKAIESVFTHSWILNPYSYFGGSFPAVIYAATTYGLLIVVWWFCYASLHLLGGDHVVKYQKMTEHLFLLIGLGSMGAMQWAGFKLYGKTGSSISGYEGITSVFIGKIIMSFISIAIGGGLFALTLRIRKTLSTEAKNA